MVAQFLVIAVLGAILLLVMFLISKMIIEFVQGLVDNRRRRRLRKVVRARFNELREAERNGATLTFNGLSSSKVSNRHIP